MRARVAGEYQLSPSLRGLGWSKTLPTGRGRVAAKQRQRLAALSTVSIRPAGHGCSETPTLDVAQHSFELDVCFGSGKQDLDFLA